LGGKNPVIVFDDADLERALDAVVFMIYSLNGERCTSSSRLLIQESIALEFTERLAARVRRLRVGHPLDPQTEIGPLIHPRHLQKVLSYFEVARADPYVAELLANAGFDWLLFDAEHAPNDVRTVLAQLQAVAPYPVHSIVRPVQGDVALIKQYLDIGAQTLLIPMVESAEQAARIVAATRYPPHGVRGVGSALARASRWNRIDGYCSRLPTRSACWCRSSPSMR
jgi:hypothetical protein